MLSEFEFQEFLEELAELYGGKPYPSMIAAELRKELRYLSGQELRDVKRRLMMAHTRQPSAANILDASRDAVNRAYEREQREVYNVPEEKKCKHCGNTGRIEAKRKGSPAWEQTYTFRCSFCDCRDQLNLSRSIPFWEERKYGDHFDRRSLVDWTTIAKESAEVVRSDMVKLEADPNDMAEVTKGLIDLMRGTVREID